MQEILETGARIQTLRQCFNIREGINPADIHLPPRLAGIPPQDGGPLGGIAIDIESLTSEYFKAMGWDPATGFPAEATLKRFGLSDLVGKGLESRHWSIDQQRQDESDSDSYV
jgi:aldehyde:ferredoxin oxidoreductase